jgi:hypothetical protein
VISAELWVFRWIVNRMPVLGPSLELMQDEPVADRQPSARIA